MLSLHGSIHVGQFNLATEIHINGGALDGGISEVLHRISQLEKQSKSMMCKEMVFPHQTAWDSIKLHELLTLGSLMPVRLVCGLSKTRKAAKLAV